MQNTIPSKILSKILRGIVLSLALAIIAFTQGAYAKTTEERANFRNVQAGSMGQNVLYRSAHPVQATKSGSTTRARAANRLAQQHGIQAVLNLDDSDSDIKKNLKKFNATPSNYYYAALYEQGKVSPSGMPGPDGNRNSSYRKKMTKAIKFFATHEGPYLVHCAIGRDRTGITIELLLGLMGASYDYMFDDWAKSDPNLRGTSVSEARENARKRLNADLGFITGKNLKDSEWKKVDFRSYAENFLKKGGMSSSEIAALKANLSKSYTTDGKLTDGGGGGGGGGSSGGGGGGSSSGGNNKGNNNNGNNYDNGLNPGVTVKPDRESKCTTILDSSLCDETNGEENIIHILKFVINTFTIGVATLGTIGIIYSSYIIMSSSGDESKIRKAKTRILEIVIGFLLWAIFYGALSLLIPDAPNIEEESPSETTALVVK